MGIAIGSGTDIAIDASDVTLMRGDLEGVVSAIALSRRTMRTMKQNPFWAFAYNVVGIPAIFRARRKSEKILFIAVQEKLNYEGVVRILDIAKNAVGEDLKIAIVSDEKLAIAQNR